MGNHRQRGRVNVKALIILVLVAGVLLGGAAGAYKIRKRVIANRALAAGKVALQQRNWPEACKQLKQYLGRYPDNPEMLARYAEANLAVRPLKTENIGAAIGAYRRFLRLQPGEQKASHELADLYLHVGDLQEALHVSRQRLEAEPGDVKAKLSLGRALIGLGKPDEARDQWLEPLVKDHPDQVDAYLLLAEIARQDRSDGSEAVLVWLDRAVTNNPKSVSALLSRAAFRQGLSREPTAATATAPAAAKTRDEAILADLDAADALKPKDPRLLRLAFGIWMERGQLDRAEAELRAMEALDEKALAESDVEPDVAGLLKYSAAGQLAVRRGNAREGVSLADRVLQELTGNQRLPFLETAIELYLVGDELDKARKTLEELRKGVEPRLAGDPALAEGLAVLSAAVTVKDPGANPFGAIAQLRDVVLAKPSHARAWKLLGDAYVRSGQDLRAMAAFEERLRLMPGDHESALTLAKAYLSLEPRRAAQFAALAERSRPDDLPPKVVRIAAQIEASRANPASVDRNQVGQELADLRRSHPESAEVRVLVARLALTDGKLDEGLAELGKAVEESDDKALAAVQLSICAQEQGRSDDALTAARRAIDLRRDLAGPRIRLAGLQETAKHLDEARKTLEQAAAELQGHEKLRAEVVLSRFLMAHDAREQGIALCRRLASEQPYDTHLRLALLSLPETQADAAAAQTLVDDLRKIEGDKGLIWPVEQARLWLASRPSPEREQEIIGLLTRVIDAGSAGPEPVLMLGGLYASRGDPQKAEETFRRSLDSRPIFIPVVHRLLGLLEKQGRFAEASTLLERLPKDVAALSGHRVNVGVGLGDYNAAIDEMQQRMAADPQDAASRITMARLVYTQSKDAKAAFVLLDQAAGLSPDLPELLSSRVAILRADGRSDEALSLLDREVVRRDDFSTYHLRAAFHEAAGQPDLAEKDYRHLTTFKDSATRGCEALALFYGRSGKADQSIATCEAALKEAPDDLGLRRILAAALISHGQPDLRQRGQRMVDDLLKQAPNDATLLLVKAQVLMQDADPTSTQAAAVALERVVSIEPRNVRAHLLLIELARTAGDNSLADQRIVRALGANPGDRDVLLAKAMLDADAKNSTMAHQIAQKIVDQDPQYAPALNLLASLALRGGDVASAERHNTAALAASPDNEGARLGQAAVLMAKGQPTEALACVEAYRKTEAGGKSVNCHLALAQLHVQAKRFEDAGQALDEAQRLAPVSPPVLVARLQWLAAQNRWDDLADLAINPPAGTPDVAAFREMTATMLASTGDAKRIKAALNLCQIAAESEPQRISAHLKLGEVAFMAGDLATAERAYRKTLELAPEHQQALNDLAWILGTAAAKPQEAIQFADRGVSKYPADPHLRDTRAAILIRLGRLDEARADLEQCLNLTRESPATRVSALRQLGGVLVKQGQVDQARQRYAEALKVDQDSHVLAEADRKAIQETIQSLPR